MNDRSTHGIFSPFKLLAQEQNFLFRLSDFLINSEKLSNVNKNSCFAILTESIILQSTNSASSHFNALGI